ncbi:MAG: SCP2 sterol-binding domain-containing protein [Kiloniellales bacterium]|nr:SCP2 sterol-binding domain-containing protein [Kiloniellales bacterium]
MSLDSLTEAIRSQATLNPPLGYKVKFDLGELGIIFWDGTGTTPEISNQDLGVADTTMEMTEEDFRDLVNGILDPQLAYMTGKLKVEGSLGVALKLAGMMGD